MVVASSLPSPNVCYNNTFSLIPVSSSCTNRLIDLPLVDCGWTTLECQGVNSDTTKPVDSGQWVEFCFSCIGQHWGRILRLASGSK